MKRFLVLLVLASLCAGSAAALGKRPPVLFADLERTDIRVITASGRHDFKVWIADDEKSRDRGLMFIKSLPADQGMLFLFEQPRYAAFWMKDTYLSLDLVFIGPDGVVVNVAAHAKPLSLDAIESDGPVRAVLEVLAGTADRIGLQPGDHIRHPAFGNGR